MDLIAFTIILGIFSIMYLIVGWMLHISGRKYKKSYGWVTYKRFKEEFNKYDWSFQERTFTDVLVNTEENSIIDLSWNNIKFYGSDMIINNPIGYFLAIRLIHKHKKKLKPKNEVVNW